MDDFKLKKCTECKGTQLVDVVVKESRTFDGIPYNDTIPARECAQCGEQYFAYPDLHAQSARLVVELKKLATHGREATEFLRKWELALKKIPEAKAAYEAEPSPSCKM